MIDETLLTLASDIVCAHVSNNTVTADELPVLIRSVHASLSALGQEPEESDEKREPAVSVRASVKPEVLVCLECGAKMKMLKRHLATDHGLTPAEYRKRWNLASDYPMVAPQYAAKRKELALKIGLGRKAKTDAGAAPVDVKAPAPATKRKKATTEVEGEAPAKRRGRPAKAVAPEPAAAEA
ncbi:MucR family transcriptional regulator [Novosphingobium terrae]|uniref:MucR family transcriptional regulator n=1 Tax=Novosphingobium terrae TaxID=2726189 RepID=UPI00197DB1E8|nr:MucR family transcriptional regulator [Novosphingobium terrae]